MAVVDAGPWTKLFWRWPEFLFEVLKNVTTAVLVAVGAWITWERKKRRENVLDLKHEEDKRRLKEALDLEYSEKRKLQERSEKFDCWRGEISDFSNEFQTLGEWNAVECNDIKQRYLDWLEKTKLIELPRNQSAVRIWKGFTFKPYGEWVKQPIDVKVNHAERKAITAFGLTISNTELPMFTQSFDWW